MVVMLLIAHLTVTLAVLRFLIFTYLQTQAFCSISLQSEKSSHVIVSTETEVGLFHTFEVFSAVWPDIG